MQPIYTTKITKFKADENFITDDVLVREIKFDVILNGEKVASMMATPVDLDALAVGYIMSENIVSSYEDIKSVKLADDFLSVKIEANANLKSIENLSFESVVISGCGRSVTANIDPEALAAKAIKSAVNFKRAEISRQMSEFYTQCELYEQTGCVHTAKIYAQDGRYFIGEDIAQHNTIDKAVGKAALAGVNLSECFLMVSGRLSSEMVVKAVMNGVPALISRTAPTSLGVLIARKFNLTLCGFARGENFNVYSGEERIYV